MSNPTVENLVIIGSGPAGYTAGLYAARANLKPVMFEGFQAGGVPGGQLMTTSDVENYPGFPEGITGPKLMQDMKAQAKRWGTEIYTEDVVYADLKQRPFTIRSQEREVKAHSVIIATGANAKRLHLPNEDKFWNIGISACAICDGANPMFKGNHVVVIGGGDSAAEEAVYVTKYCDMVHLLVRRDQMRASKTMQDRVLNHPKVTVHWNTEAVDVYGQEGGFLEGVKIINNQTGEQSNLPARGLFYAIGHTPNTKLFQGQLDLDDVGYIITKPDSVETSLEGVYAAGDVQDHEFRQAVTAAGTGCQAAMLAERWLSANELATEYHQETSEETTQETASTPEEDKPVADTEETFDINKTRHYGGYALRKLFHESDRVLIVKYVGPNCGLCATLAPLLDGVIDEYEDKVHFVEIDIAEEPEIAEKAMVTGTPTVQFFRNQEIVDQLRGVKQKSDYRQRIEQYLQEKVSAQ